MSNEQLKNYHEFCIDLWKYFKEYSAGITEMNSAVAVNDGVKLLNRYPNVVRAEYLIVAVQTQLEHIGRGEF